MPKLKKFCRITKFLEQNDKELYQTLDDLCLFGLFRTHGRGVTFLYPTDKAFKKKIVDAAYSDHPEKAVDMIRSLVLLDFLASPKDFESRKDDIPNASRKRLEVASTDSKSVTLKSGHKLTIESKFLPIRSNDPVAIYNLSGKGELPSGPASTMKYAAKKKNGGYYGGGVSKASLVDFVETTYDTANKTGDKVKKNIYKAFMSYLYKHALNTNDDDVIQRVFNGMCASARASFYVLVCPYSSEDPYQISDLINRVVDFGERARDDVNTAINDCMGKYNDLRNKIIDKGREKLIGTIGSRTDATDEARNKILSQLDTSADLRTLLYSAYNNDENRIAKDVFTVYCFLSAGSKEDQDIKYFNTCFRYIVKHIYNDLKSVLSHNRDLAFSLTLYLNLIKSDAFIYEPFKNTEKRAGSTEFPVPTDKAGRFTIEKGTMTEKHGGNGESLSAFMAS